ncbi:MAG TPA: hypothetical protein VND64_11585 [Pirellulales bacterium]|nr:hypothetical protein [Pirellulales bacterium]
MLGELEIRSRGVASLIEDCKADRDFDRQITQVESVVSACLPSIELAANWSDYFREHAHFPGTAATCPYSRFVTLLRTLIASARDLESSIAAIEAGGFAVSDADRFRDGICLLESIVDEDQFATDAAFLGGAGLDTMNEFEGKLRSALGL